MPAKPSSNRGDAARGASVLGTDPTRLGNFSLGLHFGGGGSSTNGSDHLIVARCKDEHQREQMSAQKHYYAQSSIHSQFERSGNSSFARKEMQRRINQKRKMDAEHMEVRRQKLRALYDVDSASWREQLLLMESSSESRIDKMRARVADLKSKREAERVRIVEEKLDQQKRLNSDDLRVRRSKEMVYQVTAARGAQIEEHRIKNIHEQEQRIADDAAWEAQRQAKAVKEDAELARRRAADYERMRALEVQIADLAALKHAEAMILQQEADIARADHQVAMIREAHETRKRRVKEQALRAELNLANAKTISERAAAAKAELEQDLKWLASLEQADTLDRAAVAEKKASLRQELLEFRNHVEAQKAAIEARSQEVERSYRIEEDRQWRIRTARWNAERQAREKLMEDVIRSREEQLQSRHKTLQQELQMRRMEREQLERLLENERRELQAKREKHHREQVKYQNDIKSQMADNKERAMQQAHAAWAEYEHQRQREIEYEEWLERELSRPLAMV